MRRNFLLVSSVVTLVTFLSRLWLSLKMYLNLNSYFVHGCRFVMLKLSSLISLNGMMLEISLEHDSENAASGQWYFIRIPLIARDPVVYKRKAETSIA